jgi:hypothetical protein
VTPTGSATHRAGRHHHPTRLEPGGPAGPAGRIQGVSELSPQDRLVLANLVANARLESQELPAEDLVLTAAHLAGELDTATYEQRLLDLVTSRRDPEARSA